jgi:hypothetical protein
MPTSRVAPAIAAHLTATTSLGYFDGTADEGIKHLIVDFGHRRGSTTEIVAMHHEIGEAHRVAAPAWPRLPGGAFCGLLGHGSASVGHRVRLSSGIR